MRTGMFTTGGSITRTGNLCLKAHLVVLGDPSMFDPVMSPSKTGHQSTGQRHNCARSR